MQREYDRYANLNFTQTSSDGNGVFQFIPWCAFDSRINYDGDLANDVQGVLNGDQPQYLAGLQQDQRSIRMRACAFRSSAPPRTTP